MSDKEFKSQCEKLSTLCTSKNHTGEDCNAHISKFFLENITSKFITILKQSDTISKDWERKKELHLRNQGYLNIAANFPEIM